MTIKLRDVSHRFGAEWALTSLNLDLVPASPACSGRTARARPPCSGCLRPHWRRRGVKPPPFRIFFHGLALVKYFFRLKHGRMGNINVMCRN
jgi:hypothetical protein